VGCRHSEQVVRMTVSVFRLVAGRSAHRRGRRDRCVNNIYSLKRSTDDKLDDAVTRERNRRRKTVSRTVFEKRGGPRRGGSNLVMCI